MRLLIALAFVAVCWAQPSQVVIIPGSPPGGAGAACTDTAHGYLATTGMIYTCQSATWQAQGGSSGTCGSPNCTVSGNLSVSGAATIGTTVTSPTLGITISTGAPAGEQLFKFPTNETGSGPFEHVLTYAAPSNGCTKNDNIYTWGYNIGTTGKVQAGEHSFIHNIESRYCPADMSGAQLEEYFDYNGSDGTTFRPFSITIKLGDHTSILGIRSDSFVVGDKGTAYDWMHATSSTTQGTLQLSLKSNLDFAGNTVTNTSIGGPVGFITYGGAAILTRLASGAGYQFVGGGNGTDVLQLFPQGDANNNNDLLELLFGGAGSHGTRGIRWSSLTGSLQFEYQHNDLSWNAIESAASLDKGQLPLARLGTLVNGNCVQVKSDGSALETASGACGTGGSTSPGGVAGDIQWNNAGSFAGSVGNHYYDTLALTFNAGWTDLYAPKHNTSSDDGGWFAGWHTLAGAKAETTNQLVMFLQNKLNMSRAQGGVFFSSNAGNGDGAVTANVDTGIISTGAAVIKVTDGSTGYGTIDVLGLKASGTPGLNGSCGTLTTKTLTIVNGIITGCA